MEYSLLVHPAASDQLASLPSETDRRIRNKVREIVSHEFRTITDFDVERVRGVTHRIYRARIGDFRVFFVVDETTIGILHVERRDTAYTNLEPVDRRAGEFSDRE